MGVNYCADPVIFDGHRLNVSHFFNGKANAFSAEAALFIATVRHVIDTKARRVVNDHATEVQVLDGS